MNAPDPLPVVPAIEQIPLGAINASKANPRKTFDKTAMEELTASVKAYGVLQPILLRPLASGAFELVAGERRYRAAKGAGLATIPAIVRSLTEVEADVLRLIENLQREGLHELEEAEGYERLIKSHKYNADEIAAKVGKSRAYVYSRLKLTALEPEARKAFYDDKLNASTALLLARIPTRPLQLEALKDITAPHRGRDAEPLSFREAQRHVHEKYMLRLVEAPFSTSDPKLVPSAGSCADCPKRTGSQPELFADVKSADVCTDPGCFAEKRAAAAKIKKDEALAKGQRVIAGPEAKKLFPYEGMKRPTETAAFVATDDERYVNGKHTKVSKVIGADVERVLVEHPESKQLIEVVPRAAFEKAAKQANGTKRRDSGPDPQRAKEAKARLETKIRTRILEAIHTGLAEAKLTTADGVLIAKELFERVGQLGRDRVVPLWRPPTDDKLTGVERMNDAYKREKALVKSIAAMTESDLVRLMLECVIADQIHVNSYGSLAPSREMSAIALRAGVDTAKIRDALNAEVKAKQKPKKSTLQPAKAKPKTRTAKVAAARA